MAYTPKNWKDLPDETTPIQASDLNHIEQGIGDLSTKVDTLNTNVGDLSTLNTTEKSNLVGAINELYQNNVYSTDETVVGKWIDGKPIYRKVIANNVSCGRSTAISISNLNIDTLIEVKSFAKRSNENRWVFDSFYDNPSRKFNIHRNENDILTWTGDNETYIATIWIEYTKTTD